jgi:hypothetical protein
MFFKDIQLLILISYIFFQITNHIFKFFISLFLHISNSSLFMIHTINCICNSTYLCHRTSIPFFNIRYLRFNFKFFQEFSFFTFFIGLSWSLSWIAARNPLAPFCLASDRLWISYILKDTNVPVLTTAQRSHASSLAHMMNLLIQITH